MAGKWSRWILLAMAGSMLVAAWSAYPRLSHSLWGDEDYSLRYHLHGYFKRNVDKVGYEDGRPYFRLLGWRDAVFGYRNTNNHFLYSIVGKSSLVAWQKITGAPGYAFNETVLRIVPFLAGVIACGLWVYLTYRLGMPRSALILALLLPWHPWFIRYISEARGYAFVLLFLPLALLALRAALLGGRWRAWICYGLSQFLLLYSWPGLALQVVALNMMALGILLFGKVARSGARQRLPQFWRWAVVNLMTVMALAQMVAPCAPQVRRYLEVDQLTMEMGSYWLRDLLGLFYLGTSWNDFYYDRESNPLYLCLTRIAENHTSLVFPFLWLVIGLVVVGALRFAWKAGFGLWLVPTLVLPGVAFYLYGDLRTKYLFPWYFVYALPVALIFLASGLAWIGGLLSTPLRGKPRLVVQMALPILFAGFYCYLGSFKLRLLRDHSVDPLRESVLLTRPNLDPNEPRQREMLTGHVHFGAFCYDAHGYPVDQPYSQHPMVPGLTKMMRWSDGIGVPLSINMGFVEDARATRTDLMDILDNRELFHPPEPVWALEPQLVRQIFRYRGGFFPSGE